MADSPTSSLTQTFESLCVGISKELPTTTSETKTSKSDKADQKKQFKGRKIRHNSDSVLSVDKSKGNNIAKCRKSLTLRLRKEQVEQFLDSTEHEPVRRSARRRRRIATDTAPSGEEDPAPSSTHHQARGCRVQANDVTVDELAGDMENALFIPRPMSSMAEMMYTWSQQLYFTVMRTKSMILSRMRVVN